MRNNGVWSHQVEAEYSEKFAERLPSDWVEKMENINQIKVDMLFDVFSPAAVVYSLPSTTGGKLFLSFP